MKKLNQQVAILATGDELTNGDIVNTNASYIAHRLYEHQIPTGQQLTIADDQKQLEEGIHYLLARHQVLITIGGLGPTSDDRTRFALSAALAKPLQFNDESWQRIVARLTQYNLEIPPSNRQQAMFPHGALVIPNNSGTADACEIGFNNQVIYMLPGPPKECLPIFDEAVLPKLQSYSRAATACRKNWLLMNISEGTLAHQLDVFIDEFLQIGYRFEYPYVELKISSPNTQKLHEKIELIKPFIENHIVSENKQTASQQLRNTLVTHEGTVNIIDKCTGGRLQAAIENCDTHRTLSFDMKGKADIQVVVTGLEEYWQNQTSKTAKLVIEVNDEIFVHQLRFLGERVLSLAVETACLEIQRYIQGAV